MHTITVPRLAALLTLLLAALATVPAAAEAELLNRVVIRVNDRIATLHDYRQRVEEMEQGIIQADAPLAERREALSRLPQQVYRTLLEEQLLLSRADQLGIVFTDEEVDAQLRRMRDNFGFSTDREFEAALSQSGNTLREYREQLRTNMRIQELLAREVRSQLDVDEEQARIYYRDNPEQFTSPQRLRLEELVVLEDAQVDPAERLELARALRAEILAGAAIQDVVAEYAEQGLTSGAIDLGWVVSGDLARELEESVWDLAEGDVSEPVESRGGIHVIRVVEREDAGVRPFNDVADDARRRASQQAFNEAMEGYMEELEESSFVLLDPPPGAEGFRSAGASPIPMPEEPETDAVEDEATETPDAPTPPDPER